MKLTIYSDIDSFEVYDNDILQLELKLNMSKYSKEWSKIGDYLYNYYVKEGYIDQPQSMLEVTSEQYHFLLDLYKNDN
tara:strand:+ start:1227 stop:1460 length:234 start_codon:yes stop_codon:yes gene_type:complete